MQRISQQFKDFITAYAVIADAVEITEEEGSKVRAFCVAIEYQPQIGGKYYGLTIETARKRFYKDLRERVSAETMMALDRGYSEFMRIVQERKQSMK